MSREGFYMQAGFDCRVDGRERIIQAGTSRCGCPAEDDFLDRGKMR
jgi:hypothetical protein